MPRLAFLALILACLAWPLVVFGAEPSIPPALTGTAGDLTWPAAVVMAAGLLRGGLQITIDLGIAGAVDKWVAYREREDTRLERDGEGTRALLTAALTQLGLLLERLLKPPAAA